MWHFGKHGFSHNDSGRIGLIVEGPEVKDDSAAQLISDGHWKTARHPDYLTADLPPPNLRLAEQNLKFDARKNSNDWQPGENITDWSQATACDDADSVWGTLQPRPIAQWRDYGVRD